MGNASNRRVERGIQESTARSGGFIFSVSEAEEDDLLMLIAVFSRS